MRLNFLVPLVVGVSLISAQAASAQQPIGGTVAAGTAASSTVEAGGLFGTGLFAGGGLFGLGAGLTFGVLAFTGILIGVVVSENTGGNDQPNSP